MTNRGLSIKDLMILVLVACGLLAGSRQGAGVWATGILPGLLLGAIIVYRHQSGPSRLLAGWVLLSFPAFAALLGASLPMSTRSPLVSLAIVYEALALVAWAALTRRGWIGAIAVVVAGEVKAAWAKHRQLDPFFWGFWPVALCMFPTYLVLFAGFPELRSSLFTVQMLDEIFPLWAREFPPEWDKSQYTTLAPVVVLYYQVGQGAICFATATAFGNLSAWLARLAMEREAIRAYCSSGLNRTAI